MLGVSVVGDLRVFGGMRELMVSIACVEVSRRISYMTWCLSSRPLSDDLLINCLPLLIKWLSLLRPLVAETVRLYHFFQLCVVLALSIAALHSPLEIRGSLSGYRIHEAHLLIKNFLILSLLRPVGVKTEFTMSWIFLVFWNDRIPRN